MTAYSDEMLMAFADGALEEPTFSEVAAAIEADPTLAERVEVLARGRDVARDGFGPAQPAPFLLRRKVEMAIARAEQPRPRFMPLAAAAAVAVIVALPLGWFAGQQTASTAPQTLLASAELGGEIATLLSTLPSGQEQRLAEGPLLRTIGTFNTAGGSLCREFELDSAENAAVVVSCRDAGTWRIAFSTSSTPAGDGYAPASSLEALDAWLTATGAGAPLSAEDEARALAERGTTR